MSYQVIQDARQSTQLGACAQAVLSAQARVAKAASELRAASEAHDEALAVYEGTRAYLSGPTMPRCATCGVPTFLTQHDEGCAESTFSGGGPGYGTADYAEERD